MFEAGYGIILACSFHHNSVGRNNLSFVNGRI